MSDDNSKGGLGENTTWVVIGGIVMLVVFPPIGLMLLGLVLYFAIIAAISTAYSPIKNKLREKRIAVDAEIDRKARENAVAEFPSVVERLREHGSREERAAFAIGKIRQPEFHPLPPIIYDWILAGAGENRASKEYPEYYLQSSICMAEFHFLGTNGFPKDMDRADFYYSKAEEASFGVYFANTELSSLSSLYDSFVEERGRLRATLETEIASDVDSWAPFLSHLDKCDSPPERLLLKALIRVARLQSDDEALSGEIRVVPQAKLSAGRVDFLIDDNIVVEVDGWEYHSSKDAFANDRTRDRILVSDGFRVMRYTASEVNADAVRIAKDLVSLASRQVPTVSGPQD